MSSVLKGLTMLTTASAPGVLPTQPKVKRYFFISKICFAAIGMDPTSEERTIFNQLRAWLPMLSLLTLCFPMTIYALQHLDDMNQVTDALSPVLQSSLAIMKGMIFMWFKKRVVKLVRLIWSSNLQADNEELDIIVEENNHEAMLSILYYSSVLMTGTLALLAPFLMALFHTWRGEDFWESLHTPLKGVYIVDPKASIWGYAFAYVWTIAGIYYVVHGTLAVDSLFSWIVHNISAKFRILNFRLKSFAEKTSALDGNGSDEIKFRETLAECIIYHRGVIDCVKRFNEVYKMTVFVIFIISCVQIAFVAFQFVRGAELAAQLFNFSFLMSVTIQLMLYCYGGQRLTDESSSIAVAIYEHFHWHNLSVKSRKILMLLLIRAQKPSNLLGIFFVADLSLFLWVYKTAGSFITLLMTLEQK